MKKLCLSFIAAFSLVTAVSSFAAAQNNPRNYQSTVHPNAALAKASKAKGRYGYTDIYVYNNSADVITAIVPGEINDPVYPHGTPDEITADGALPTHLVLRDAYGNYFFDANICHFARVYVEGYPGASYANVDSSRC